MRDSSEADFFANRTRHPHERSGHRLCKPRKSISDIGTSQSGEGSHSFQISTRPDGFNAGRCYYLKTDSLQSCESIVNRMQKMVSAAKSRAEGASRLRKSQQMAKNFYDSTLFQIASCILIVLVRIVL
jgi:hypothetical protein